MKTLEQTLEELKQLEHLVSSGKEFSEDEMKSIIDKLESSFVFTSGELEKIEENSLKILENEQNEQNEDQYE